MALLICVGGTETPVTDQIAQFGVENAVELCEHIWALQLSDPSEINSARDRLLQLKVKPESIPLQVVTVNGWSLVRVLGPSSLEEVRTAIPSEYVFSIQPRIGESMKGTQITFFVGFCGKEDLRARVLEEWQALGWGCGIVKNNALYADVVGMTAPDAIYKRSQSTDNLKHSDQLNALLINKISLLGVFYPPMPITSTANTPSPAAILQAGRRRAPDKPQRATGIGRGHQYAQRTGMDKNRFMKYEWHGDTRRQQQQQQQQMTRAWDDNNQYYSYRDVSSRFPVNSGWGDGYQSDFFGVTKTPSSLNVVRAEGSQGYSDHMIDQDAIDKASDPYTGCRRHESCKWDMSTSHYTHCDAHWRYASNESMIYRHGGSVNTHTASSLFQSHDGDFGDNNPPNANDIPVPTFMSRKVPMKCSIEGDDDRLLPSAMSASYLDSSQTNLLRASDWHTLENKEARLLRAESSDMSTVATTGNLGGDTTLRWLQ